MVTDISVDQRIDAFFTQYEKNSLPDAKSSLALNPPPMPSTTVPEGFSRKIKIWELIENSLAAGGVMGFMGVPVTPVKKKKPIRKMEEEMGGTYAEELPLKIRKETHKEEKFTLRSLYEADEPPDMPPDMPDAGGPPDMPGDEPASGDEDKPEGEPHTDDVKAPTKPQKPNINIGIFARDTARLVSSYQNLIDIKTIIINRAKAYILRNYDEQKAEELIKILDVEYSLLPREELERPIAVGASVEPGGGSGGGGGSGPPT